MASEARMPDAAIVITTKNRKDELATAIRSALSQTAQVEVLVIDDGSTDGTASMVVSQFPTVRFYRFEHSEGLIVRRNLGANLAHAPIIFSIDDDAEFSSPDIVAQILPCFADDRVGAVAIPFTEPHKTGDTLFQSAPSAEGDWETAIFIGTAHAVRRDLFLSLGGYRGALVHQGEESDYAIRMIDAGYRTMLGRSDPIYHYESPKRDWSRMDYYGSRNTILFGWQNVPFPIVVPITLVATIRTAAYTLRWGRLRTRLRGIFDAYRLFFSTERRPVAQASFARFHRLKRGGPALRHDPTPGGGLKQPDKSRR